MVVNMKELGQISTLSKALKMEMEAHLTRDPGFILRNSPREEDIQFWKTEDHKWGCKMRGLSGVAGSPKEAFREVFKDVQIRAKSDLTFMEEAVESLWDTTGD